MSAADLAALAERAGAELPPALLDDIAAELERRGTADPRAVGDVYESWVARDQPGRRAGGVYYTPPHLVDFVVDRTVGPAIDAGADPRVIDPACGGGAFLLGALARGASGHRLVGVDIDPVAASVCKLALALAGVLDADIRVADALLDDLDLAPVDCVIGNPPWGQKRLRFSTEVGARLRDRYSTARGVLDPFKLFIERGLELCADGGRLGMVLPDIILLKNHQPVRDLLLTETAIEWLVHAGRAFADVNLDAAVAVVRKARADVDHPVRIWRQLPESWRALPPAQHRMRQSVFGELPGHRFNLYLDRDSLGLIKRLASLPRLGDRFEVHEGVHSGNARDKLFLDQARGDQCVPLIVGKGELARFHLAWAGRWLDRDPAALDRDAGDYANLGRPEWHLAQKLIVRRTGDHIVCAFDANGYHVSNNAFVVVPRRDMSEDELRGYAGLLNSRFLTWYFRAVQPRVGRLFAELKINHLVDLPLPHVDIATLGPIAGQLAELAGEGAELDHAMALLDDAVEHAFGLTAAERELVRGEN